MTALLLFDASAVELASRTAEALTADGVPVETMNVVDIHHAQAIANNRAVVIVTDQPSADLMYWLGYIAAERRSTIMVSTSRQLPPLLQRWPRVDPAADSDWEIRLVSNVRKVTGWSSRQDVPRGNPDDLIDWIAADTSRLEQLAASDLEALFATLLTQFNFNMQTMADGTVLQNDDGRRRFLAQFKFGAQNETLGISAVREYLSVVQRFGCEFGLLVTNRRFTPAAVEFALECTPPIWLLSREWIVSAIQARTAKPRRSDALFNLSKAPSVPNVALKIPKQINAFDGPAVGSKVPIRVFYMVSGRENAEVAKIRSFLDREWSWLTCHPIDLEGRWQGELRAATATGAKVHVILLNYSTQPEYWARTRVYKALSILNQWKDRISPVLCVDESPEWARMCVPAKLNPKFLHINDFDHLTAYVRSWEPSGDNLEESSTTGASLVTRPPTSIVQRRKRRPKT